VLTFLPGLALERAFVDSQGIAFSCFSLFTRRRQYSISQPVTSAIQKQLAAWLKNGKKHHFFCE